MVYRNNSSTPVSKSSIEFDQSVRMTVSMGSLTDPCLKSRQINQSPKNNKKQPTNSSSSSSNHQICSESHSAVIDLLILIAVVGAFGFLLYPYVKFTYVQVMEIGSLVLSILKEEIYENPVIYASLGLSMVCVAIAAWAIVVCTTRRCGNPGCRGLWKAAEFDIQLETEESVKNSSNGLAKDGVNKKGLFELPRDHHRELEAELKKIAPPNGRAVLVFRARCGCCVGRMEVPGPRKVRRIKK